MDQGVVFVFCYRFFDVRLMNNTGIIDKLSENCGVVVLCPKEMVPVLKSWFYEKVKVEPILYQSTSYKNYYLSSTISTILSRFASKVLSFVYANQHKKSNSGASIYIRNYLTKARDQNFLRKLLSYFIISLVYCASRLKFVRKLLQKLYSVTVMCEAHRDYFIKYHPSLVIVPSFGLSADGYFIAESKRNGVATCVVIQSWDKTSCKGYPVVSTDYAIVWSSVMKEEAQYYMDIPPENIFVEGATLWDNHFNFKPSISKKDFCKAKDLDPDNKLIFFSVGGPAYRNNKNVMRLLIEAIRDDLFLCKTQLYIRLHPSFFSFKELLQDFRGFVNQYKDVTGVHYEEPDCYIENGFIYFSQDDFEKLAALFTYCDASVSIYSSHMVECAIFDKPSVNVGYGRWKSNVLDLDLREYSLEHIYRIVNTGAIYNSSSDNELIANINKALHNPGAHTAQRRNLVDQEALVNKGRAVICTARRIAQLAEKNYK